MIRLPIYYSSTYITDLYADDDLHVLKHLVNIYVRIPDKVRKLASNRPDVMVALMREDDTLLNRLRPMIRFQNTHIPFNQIALHRDVLELVVATLLSSSRDAPTQELSVIRGKIGRIVSVNGNRLDCRRDNLREVCLV